MKKICFVFLSVVGISFSGQSKVLTVSNNTNSPGQYTDLQAACDAASDYDTIYIHASEKAYDAVNVKKPLVLIGEGALPNQQVLWGTNVSSITFTHDIGSDLPSSGSRVYGIHAGFKIGVDKSNKGISGIVFERCKGVISCDYPSAYISGLSIHQFIGSIGNNTYMINAIISNSILSNISMGYSSSNNIIRNCILSSYPQIYGAVVANNIFYQPNSTGNFNAENTTFTNNVCYFSDNPFPIQVAKNVTYTGNIVDKNPKFVQPATAAEVSSYETYTKTPFANFTLSTGSPALTLGTDGTQAGIYGGPTPWVDGGEGVYRYFAMPSQVPYVTDMDILNTAIPLNGTLNVKIKAKTQQ
jgi:hypothetical protein